MSLEGEAHVPTRSPHCHPIAGIACTEASRGGHRISSARPNLILSPKYAVQSAENGARRKGAWAWKGTLRAPSQGGTPKSKGGYLDPPFVLSVFYAGAKTGCGRLPGIRDTVVLSRVAYVSRTARVARYSL